MNVPATTIDAPAVHRSSPHDRRRGPASRDTDGVAWLTLNRPAARNALSMGLMEALVAELARIETDPSVKVVVIGGAGAGFCAGHDLRESARHAERALYEATFALCSRLMLRLVRLPKPVIARVHGVATAARAASLSQAAIWRWRRTPRASPRPG